MGMVFEQQPRESSKAVLRKEFFGAPEVQPYQHSECFVEKRERKGVCETPVAAPKCAKVPVRCAVNNFDSSTEPLMQITHEVLPRTDGMGGSGDAEGHDNHGPHEVMDPSVVLDAYLGDEADALAKLLRIIRLNENKNELNSCGVNLCRVRRGPIKHLLNILRAEKLAELSAQFAPSEKVQHAVLVRFYAVTI